MLVKCLMKEESSRAAVSIQSGAGNSGCQHPGSRSAKRQTSPSMSSLSPPSSSSCSSLLTCTSASSPSCSVQGTRTGLTQFLIRPCSATQPLSRALQMANGSGAWRRRHAVLRLTTAAVYHHSVKSSQARPVIHDACATIDGQRKGRCMRHGGGDAASASNMEPSGGNATPTVLVQPPSLC